MWTGDQSYFTVHAGAGMVAGSGSLSLVLEARGHKSLFPNAEFGSRDVVTLSAGGRLSW